MSGLYLHIPFCRRKCPYCDFFSVAGREELLASYHRLLIRQLNMAVDAGWRGPFATVFFGGGTPSLLRPGQVAEILEAVAAGPGLAPDAEISFEANPGTLGPDTLRQLRSLGVNRLSLGVQSLDDGRLRQLRRLHDATTACRVIDEARRAGFDNLSCDLMFALPGQDCRELEGELRRLLAFAPEHVSIYGLSIEEETPWAAAPPALPDEETYAAMYRLIHGLLADAGYRHYEISNFAQPGRECRHNLAYWRRRTCLGLGAGAHSFSAAGWGERLATPADLDLYRRRLDGGRDPMQSLEQFDRRGAMAETVYLALRTADGLSAAGFREIFGQDFAEVFAVARTRAGDALRREGDRWFLSWRDWLLYDHLIAYFL
ncbi:anaerobic coproporphyrinogen III oxidase [Geothermobacter ehrlichii]|uniref:Heme chaperone HemW n=1 Tax=Geothermobacter ehrlichii TaxID=213224 RepID=A0A5D3WGZ6_9BACT|nr:radical SAM family heme chaperone HemW [Geothermobacter ehrlichii]TYO96815.1 anaerobic coproporphyrinogen III oxidase [Geothermobacter ehrlichii]